MPVGIRVCCLEWLRAKWLLSLGGNPMWLAQTTRQRVWMPVCLWVPEVGCRKMLWPVWVLYEHVCMYMCTRTHTDTQTNACVRTHTHTTHTHNTHTHKVWPASPHPLPHSRDDLQSEVWEGSHTARHSAGLSLYTHCFPTLLTAPGIPIYFLSCSPPLPLFLCLFLSLFPPPSSSLCLCLLLPVSVSLFLSHSVSLSLSFCPSTVPPLSTWQTQFVLTVPLSTELQSL